MVYLGSLTGKIKPLEANGERECGLLNVPGGRGGGYVAHNVMMRKNKLLNEKKKTATNQNRHGAVVVHTAAFAIVQREQRGFCLFGVRLYIATEFRPPKVRVDTRKTPSFSSKQQWPKRKQPFL